MRRDANAYALASLRVCNCLPRVCFVLSRYLGRTKRGWDEVLQICRDANAYAVASLHVRNCLPRVCFVLSRYLGRTKLGWDKLLQICNRWSTTLGEELRKRNRLETAAGKGLGSVGFGLIRRDACRNLQTSLAEREGFEPPVPRGTPVFKTGVIDHSTISPVLN